MKIKVVSINVFIGGRIWDNLIGFIKTEQPDILLTQETFNSQNDKLLNYYRTFEEIKKLGWRSTAFEEVFLLEDENGKNPEGNAVFTKFDIKTSRNIYLNPGNYLASYQDLPENWPNLPRAAQYCEISAGNTLLHVVNVQGVWDLAGDNPSPARHKMIDILNDTTKDLDNVILAGDTNANINNPVLKRLEPQLKPVFDDRLKSTFNMRRKTNPGYAAAAVDLMYVSPKIKVVSKNVPNIDISDHLPLIVELEIPSS